MDQWKLLGAHELKLKNDFCQLALGLNFGAFSNTKKYQISAIFFSQNPLTQLFVFLKNETKVPLPKFFLLFSFYLLN